jgi:ABC-type Fe3+-hydroxamate transport system substrate-binding protein
MMQRFTWKRIVLMIVILVVLCACSNSTPAQPASASGQSAGQAVPPVTEKKESSLPGLPNPPSNENPKPEITVGDGANKSAPLPQGYPSDVFPLYPGSNVVSAIEFQGGYTISAFSKDEVDKVKAFYKDVLKNATVTFESDASGSFTSFGNMGKFSYNFDTGESSELEGHRTSIAIMLMPAA